MTEIKLFKDRYNNDVYLSFSENPFSSEPKHVFVLCCYRGKWLLTDHIVRGVEFPGGKVECCETPTEAAVREVCEETGGCVSSLTYIGQYKVERKGEPIVKNIYFAVVDSLEERGHYYETNGPFLMPERPKDIKKEERFSFIMKDDVLTHSLKQIAQIKQKEPPCN